MQQNKFFIKLYRYPLISTCLPIDLIDNKSLIDGYIYYDLFNQILGANMVKLLSPLIPASEDSQLCFSFWYAAFGAGESALLQISKQDNSSDGAGEKVF